MKIVGSVRRLIEEVFEMIIWTDVTLVGLEIGLLTMKKGEFSRFLFQPKYAFGDMGCPPLIPAATMVLYEVNLLDFLDSGKVDDFIALSLVGTHVYVFCLWVLRGELLHKIFLSYLTSIVCPHKTSATKEYSYFSFPHNPL